MRATASLIVVTCLLSFASVTAAQGPDARGHFLRGIEHFNEGSYDAALAEFQQAYDIAPAHQVLYNIAKVHAALGNAVEAAHAYERYLDEGGHEISAARRHEVEEALEVQNARIGRLDVRVSMDGATIAIDGDDVATSPLRTPIEVTAGEVELEVRAANHESVRRRLRVAGGVIERVEIEMVEANQPGILRISSVIPEVQVEVDGEPVGRTPFDATVTLEVGEHRLVARRPGYQTFERTIRIDRRAEADVHLEMVRDDFAGDDVLGHLALALPDGATWVARIDDEPVGASALTTLPIGRHRIELEVDERVPYRDTVDIDAGQTTNLRPALEWEPAARQERQDAASFRRTFGIGLTIGGVALLAGGVSVMGWNYAAISETNTAINAENATFHAMGCMAAGSCPDVEERLRELNAERDREATFEIVGWAISLTGAASLLTGLVLWLTAPDDESIDAAASARVDLVPLQGGGLVSARVPLSL